MNRTKRLISLLFVGLASAALFAACGDETSCLEDTECATGEICVAEVCEVTCTSDADCAAGEVCEGIDGDRAYCIAGQSNNTNNNNSNNTTGTNNNTTEPTPLYAVMIRDTTTSTEGCEISDPGSDLASVGLRDLENNILGYYAVEFFEAGDEPNGNDYPDILINIDGDAPSFELACPESFAAENVSALGCGGYVVGNFLDDMGTPIILDSSTQVNVVEYGPNCGGSADDSLEVVLCTDTAAALSGDITSCTDVIGSGSGDVVGVIN